MKYEPWSLAVVVAILVLILMTLPVVISVSRSHDSTLHRNEFQKSVESAQADVARSAARMCADGEIGFDVVFPPKGVGELEPAILINGKRTTLSELRQVVISGASGRVRVSIRPVYESTGKLVNELGVEIMTCPPSQ